MWNVLSHRLELHLVGGFEDERKNSEEVSLDLFGEWAHIYILKKMPDFCLYFILV